MKICKKGHHDPNMSRGRVKLGELARIALRNHDGAELCNEKERGTGVPRRMQRRADGG